MKGHSLLLFSTEKTDELHFGSEVPSNLLPTASYPKLRRTNRHQLIKHLSAYVCLAPALAGTREITQSLPLRNIQNSWRVSSGTFQNKRN